MAEAAVVGAGDEFAAGQGCVRGLDVVSGAAGGKSRGGKGAGGDSGVGAAAGGGSEDGADIRCRA